MSLTNAFFTSEGSFRKLEKSSPLFINYYITPIWSEINIGTNSLLTTYPICLIGSPKTLTRVLLLNKPVSFTASSQNVEEHYQKPVILNCISDNVKHSNSLPAMQHHPKPITVTVLIHLSNDSSNLKCSVTLLYVKLSYSFLIAINLFMILRNRWINDKIIVDLEQPQST